MNQHIYRLTKPYQSDKVYEAKTILHGANKCYNELKKNNIKCNSFTIININNNLIYEFNINKKPEMLLKDTQSTIRKELLNQNGENINNILKLLENRIKILETKILSK